MRAPSAGVPLPGGSPAPSGRMLMSQAAISARLIGFPRFSAWAKAALETRASASRTANSRSLRVYMLHLPAALDRPSRDGVVMLAWEAGHGRNPRGLAAHSHDLGSGRLHGASIVPSAALQYGGAAIPAPRHAEPAESLAVHGLLQCGLRPALSAVGGHHDL